ncbi:MAG TPA: sulfite exporter TauE/SafE family protein [Fibrobacteria bacterium]|nr:sulfite exporter TauE/SafE family protein [Fibrobacteria bacterium]
MNQTVGLALLGLTSGVLGGLFGIGGGAIMVPVMVLLLGFEMRVAVGTSLAAMLLPVGILGVAVYAREGVLGWKQAGILAGGLLVGNLVGALWANQTWIPENVMRIGYGALLVGIGIRYMLGGSHPHLGS